MRHTLFYICACATAVTVAAQGVTAPSVDWPEAKREAKPGTRWWWLGSAVDSANLTYNLEKYAAAGIGAVEITPIYGVKGNEANDIDYLSPRWMQMLGHVEAEGKRLGIEIDMNNGTGWPFGGPEVTIDDAASMAIFNDWRTETEPLTKKEEQLLKRGKAVTQAYEADIRPTDEKRAKGLDYATLQGVWMYAADGTCTDVTDQVADGTTLRLDLPKGEAVQFVALWNGHTRQQVKRAAPGGVGYVMDHLNPTAVRHYFERFDKAFAASGVPVPHTFFNDSYEVYQADWTPAMLAEFEARRGYRLQDHFPAFLDAKAETHNRLVADYRETMSDLLLEVFTHSWADWAHGKGAIVRNQAHGSPANLLDVYAAVDIPEIEGFGLSDFGIAGLRTDSLWKKNDADLSMLKYASSAAHVTGKPYTSSETFTWLTEHFRTSLSQCKPDMDLMLIAGVNHCYFHGTTYSPKEAAWPGYLFYASMEMSPINTIWQDAPAFFKYIERCQSFMQWGEPDNDFLVYLPVYDIWNDYDGRLLMFDIHSMAKKAPKFIKAVTTIYKEGYDMDYISDRQLAKTHTQGGRLVTEGGTAYRALIVPGARFMQPEMMSHIVDLARSGATVIFVGSYPESVPGLSDEPARRARLADAASQLPTSQFTSDGVVYPFERGRIVTAGNYPAALKLLAHDIKPEPMKSENGLMNIRRKNPTGHHYFISSLQPDDVIGWVQLGVEAEAAVLFDPMTGRRGRAALRRHDGLTEVLLQLASGQSCILQTYDRASALDALDAAALPAWTYTFDGADDAAIDLTASPWTLTSIDMQAPASAEALAFKTELGGVKPWTALSSLPEATTMKGTARYATTVKLTKKQLQKSGYADWTLDLGDVRESAHVYVNGHDAGTLFAVPYRLNIGQWLRPGKNVIEVDVTGLAANYVAQMDRDGKVWRIFKDANIANLLPSEGRESNYSGWGVMPGGLNGSVRLVPQIPVAE